MQIFVRYVLALTLFSYGFVKVFPLQMRPASLSRLIEPYGEFSPMGVAWYFIGVSTPLHHLLGTGEVLAVRYCDPPYCNPRPPGLDCCDDQRRGDETTATTSR